VLYEILKPFVRAVMRILFRLRWTGVDNVPATGPVLIAANHLSLLDPPLIAGGLPRQVHFMAKAELFRIPLFSGLIRRLNAHPIAREGADTGALRSALSLLRGGQALLIFPEGTRGQQETLGRGKAGVGMLAALGEAPVVPVYIQGTGRALPRGAVCPRPVRVTVAYGPPLRFPRARGRARYEEITSEIMAAIGRLKAEAEVAPRGGARGPAMTNHADRTARGPLPVGQQQ
jgi:1-acyl-sn-glycerol-3-phosphate acyltransferase